MNTCGFRDKCAGVTVNVCVKARYFVTFRRSIEPVVGPVCPGIVLLSLALGKTACFARTDTVTAVAAAAVRR